MRKITLLNGPNLNLLGLREPDRYGIGTLAEIVAECSAFSSNNGFDLNSFQSNSEADLINRIHSAIDDKIEGILINPGAYGHTSIGIRDAFLAASVPFVAVSYTHLRAHETTV